MMLFILFYFILLFLKTQCSVNNPGIYPGIKVWRVEKTGELYSRCSFSFDCTWKNTRCVFLSAKAYLFNGLGTCNCMEGYNVVNLRTKSCIKIGSSTTRNPNEVGECYSSADCKLNRAICNSYGRCECPIRYPVTDYIFQTCRSNGSIDSSCSRDYECIWKNAVCFNNVCACVYPRAKKSYTSETCLPEITGEIDEYCDINSDCKWTNSICKKSKCQCPEYLQQRHYYEKHCSPEGNLGDSCRENQHCKSHNCINNICQQRQDHDEDTRTRNFALGFGISIICLLLIIFICGCLGKSKCRVYRRNPRTLHDPNIAGTSSTLQLLSDLNDVPPEYSDVYLIGPHSRNHEMLIKPPTYEEAIQQSGWQSEQLFASCHVNPTFEAESTIITELHTQSVPSSYPPSSAELLESVPPSGEETSNYPSDQLQSRRDNRILHTHII